MVRTKREETSRNSILFWSVIFVSAVGFIIAIIIGITSLVKKLTPPVSIGSEKREKILEERVPRQIPPAIAEKNAVAKSTKRKKEEEKKPDPPRRKLKFVLRGNVYPPASPEAKPPPPLSDSEFYTISRDKFKAWAELPLDQMDIRYKPFFLWGHYRGMMISEMGDRCFLRRLGLYPNDIIVSVNGKKAVSPGYVKKIYLDIAKRYRTMTIKFIRGGKTYTLDFSLR